MIVKVEMLAFAEGGIREVDVPDAEITEGDVDGLLNLVFNCGQNDFKPQPIYSVSVGDVILLPTYGDSTRYFLIKAIGFQEILYDDYERYKSLDRHMRVRIAYFDDPKEVQRKLH